MGNLVCGIAYEAIFSDEREDKLAVVQTFWKRIEPFKSQIGEQTYFRLFEAHPEYEQMFKNTSVDHMSIVFMNMIEQTVMADDLDKVMLKLCAVGKIHAHFKVPKDAFSHFLDAFLAAIKYVMNDETGLIDPEELADFVNFYEMISKIIAENTEVHDVLTYPTKQEDTESDTSMPLSTALEIFQTVWQEKIESIPARKQSVGRKLYEIFFTSHPEYRHLFPGDINAQARVLMRMFSMFSAEGVEKFASRYDNLIEKHAKMGLTRKHFAHFGQALIVTLKIELGDEFSADEVKAFRQVYSLLAMPMQVAIEKNYMTSVCTGAWRKKRRSSTMGSRSTRFSFHSRKLSGTREKVSEDSSCPNSRKNSRRNSSRSVMG